MIHNISRFIAALALLATAQGAWAWSGSGTAESPYQITSTADLDQLATDVNGGNDYSGKYFVLTTDLTYSHETNWNDASSTENNYTPIGGYNNNNFRYFKGHFDGQSHTISGIRIYQSGSEAEKRYAALFGQLRNGAEVKNVFLADARFTGYYYCGPIVGNNNGRVENCHVLSDVTVHAVTTDADYHGGVVGYNDGTITGCTSAASITAAVSCKNNGGITGRGTGTVEDCIYFGSTVAGNSYVGAIIGYAASGSTVRNCYYINDGIASAVGGYIKSTIDDVRLATSDDFAVSGDTYTIGTAAGWSVMCAALYHNDTYNRFSGKTVQLGDNITVTRMAGGSGHAFTGTFNGQGHTLTLDYGTANEPVNEEFVAPFVEVTGGAKFTNLNIGGHIYADYTGTDDPGVGGLIGHLFGGITIEDCTSTVTVNSTKDRVGGFVGLCEHAVTFTNCKSSASVTCTGSGSGFVGWSRASNYTIAFEGCLFDGKVLKKNDVGSGNGGFVGWTGSTKTVSIQNSLVALDGVGSMASSNSATFARGWDGTFDNSFYTQPFGTAQGKQAHTVTAGDNVTIDAIALTGDATQYTVSGITAYSGGGLQRGETLYYGSDDQLSLTLSNSATGAPLGYRYDGYTASAGTLSGTTLTMPDEDVTISVNTATLRSDGQQHEVSYMTADGTTQTAKAIALDGHEAVDSYGYVRLDAGTYYVGTDIAYANLIRLNGNITLILADRKTMTLNGWGIAGGASNLTIYGQSLDAATAGTLRYDGTSDGIYHVNNYEQHSGNVSITTTGSSVRGIGALVTLRGGTLTISANGDYARAISGYTHNILGGHLTATATGDNATGIYASTNSGTAITLGWTNPADRITASSISTGGGTVAVATGQALTDGSGNIYAGTLDAADRAALAAPGSKTLQPCLALADAADNATQIATLNGIETAAILAGRTLYKDGSWNTLCLPFAVTTASGTLSGDNVQAMTLNTATSDLTDGTLTLNFDPATTIPAGTPFIIKWDNTGVNITNPVFEDVTVSNATNDATVEGVLTFTGTYAPVTTPADGDNTKLYLGAANKLYYPTKARTIGTHRAYFQLADGITAGEPVSGSNAKQIRAFNLNFFDDEATGILTTNFTNSTNSSNEWYSLDGVKLAAKPTAKGIYIHGGKKVVIK